MKISAVLVTRGDVDLGPCLSSIDADELVIRRGHGGVWERWEAAMGAKHEVVYTQDDDAAVEFSAVIRAYDPDLVTCNMPAWKRYEYPDQIALVGWGAVFHRSKLAEAFNRYSAAGFLADTLFRREADRVFTGLNRLKLIEAPFTHLPHAKASNRLAEQPEHGESLRKIRERIYQARKAA